MELKAGDSCPDGYKQTEVGVIPEDWEVVLLGRELENLAAGVSVNSVDEELQSYAHDQCILKTSAVTGGHFSPFECKKIAPRDLVRAKLNPRADSIIISRMNTPDLVGECGYVEFDYPQLFLPDRLWMTRFRSQSYVCVRWLSYLLSSKPYKARIKGLATGTSGSMKNIAKHALLAMSVPYPDDSEQCAIAAVLRDVDALIDALDRLIAKKRDLKQAAMQQLLTGQTRLPGFSGEWEVKRLEDVTDVDPENLSGDTRPDYAFNYISLEDVDAGNLKGYSEIMFRVAPSRARRKLRKGDVLVATVRPNLKSHLLFWSDEMHWVCSTGFAVVRCRRGVAHPSYVFFHMLGGCISRQIDTLLTGSNYPAINSADVRALEIPFPEYDEQTAIGEVLSDMDAELAVLTQRRDKTRALKQGMMQELLTGRTRLV